MEFVSFALMVISRWLYPNQICREAGRGASRRSYAAIRSCPALAIDQGVTRTQPIADKIAQREVWFRIAARPWRPERVER